MKLLYCFIADSIEHRSNILLRFPKSLFIQAQDYFRLTTTIINNNNNKSVESPESGIQQLDDLPANWCYNRKSKDAARKAKMMKMHVLNNSWVLILVVNQPSQNINLSKVYYYVLTVFWRKKKEQDEVKLCWW